MTAVEPGTARPSERIGRRAIGVLAATLSSPSAWLVGAAGFLARGGVLLLAVPVWVLPTPVEATLFLPSAAIGASGPTPEFTRVLVVLGLIGAVVVLAALLVGAACDVAAFERVAVPAGWPDRESREATDAASAAARAAGRRRIAERNAFIALALVEVAALVPVGVAVVFAADRLLQVGRVEYLTPSDLAVPFVVRVIVGASDAVAVVVASLVAADAINAIGSRLVLRRAFHVARTHARRGPAAALAGVAASLAAWLSSWIVTLVAVPPGILLSMAAWTRVRAAYPEWSTRGDPGTILAALGWTAAFVAVWVIAAAVAGAASAIRSVLWSSAFADLRGR